MTTPASPWDARIRHASIGFDNKLWVLGGLDTDTGERLNDVWYARTQDPVADFFASAISGDAPLEVQFTDTSTLPDIASWHWDFGATAKPRRTSTPATPTPFPAHTPSH